MLSNRSCLDNSFNYPKRSIDKTEIRDLRFTRFALFFLLLHRHFDENSLIIFNMTSKKQKSSGYHYSYQEPFGHQVWGQTLGTTWLGLVKAILDHNLVSFDEDRERIDLQNVRVRSNTQIIPDKLIQKYGNKKNLDLLLKLTFRREKMVDTDVVPSFPPGANSYYKRIIDGRMIDFVIGRLSMFPESKKAVMVFPNNNDYRTISAFPKNDYLPCIVSIQFRLVDFVENKNKRKSIDGYILNTIFTARSIDAFQKSYGNFCAIAELSKIIAKALSKKLKVKITVGPLDGLITDAHIYKECLRDAKNIIKKWQN